MHTETVTVAFVNEPKKNPKFGSIKTESGDYYSVPTNSLALFKPGGTYEINYKFDGTGQYRNFVSMAGESPKNPQAIDNKPVEIFVCGAINNVLQQAGTVPDAGTLAGWIRALREGWRIGFSDGLEKPANSELDDEIPF